MEHMKCPACRVGCPGSSTCPGSETTKITLPRPNDGLSRYNQHILVERLCFFWCGGHLKTCIATKDLLLRPSISCYPTTYHQHQGHGMYRWMLPLSWTVPETPCATWGANIGREPEWYAYGEEWPYLVHWNFVRSKCHLDTLDDIDLKAPLTISSTSLLGPTPISSSIQWGFLPCAGGCSIALCCTIPDHNLCGNRESLLQVFEQVDKCQKWQVFQFCWVFWPYPRLSQGFREGVVKLYILVLPCLKPHSPMPH